MKSCSGRAIFKKFSGDEVDLSLMVEKDIKGGICHIIHRYVKANNKYIKKYQRLW